MPMCMPMEEPMERNVRILSKQLYFLQYFPSLPLWKRVKLWFRHLQHLLKLGIGQIRLEMIHRILVMKLEERLVVSNLLCTTPMKKAQSRLIFQNSTSEYFRTLPCVSGTCPSFLSVV
jgi:hypothetical protein